MANEARMKGDKRGNIENKRNEWDLSYFIERAVSEIGTRNGFFKLSVAITDNWLRMILESRSYEKISRYMIQHAIITPPTPQGQD